MESVRYRRTDYARSRLQNLAEKAEGLFRQAKSPFVKKGLFCDHITEIEASAGYTKEKTKEDKKMHIMNLMTHGSLISIKLVMQEGNSTMMEIAWI